MKTISLAVLLALAVVPAEAATYLDAGTFLAAAGASADAVFTSPNYTVVTQDAFGTNSGNVNSRGEIRGGFSCATGPSQCSGAYLITVTFPFQIVGYGGSLNYFDQAAVAGYSRLVFDIPRSAFGQPPYTDVQFPDNYIGFYGQTFASTNTLAFLWQPGQPP